MGKMNKWGNILSSISNALRGKTTKRKAEKFDPFDIFSNEFKSAFSKINWGRKDRETNKEKDGITTGVETYLARKKAHKKRTSVDYNDEDYTIKTPFSSPSEEQQINEPTNTEGFGELETASINYEDPIISTKETPTSKKMGVARPGPSTFLQTARYNPQTKRLNVQYTDGTIFPYYDVSPELADRILKKRSSHSPGQEMLNTIFYGHGTTKEDQIGDIEEGM